jgi:hypothetical protein
MQDSYQNMVIKFRIFHVDSILGYISLTSTFDERTRNYKSRAIILTMAYRCLRKQAVHYG